MPESAPTFLTLSDAAAYHGAAEDPDRKLCFIFDDGQSALATLAALGQSVEVPNSLMLRQWRLRASARGFVVAEVARIEGDAPMPGWTTTGKGRWVRGFGARADQRPLAEQLIPHDDKVRQVTIAGVDGGFFLFDIGGFWVRRPKEQVKCALLALGMAGPEAEYVLGLCVLYPWRVVHIPFAAEYPGNRQWNRDAPQLRCEPIALGGIPNHPHWDKILTHTGHDLNVALANLDWAHRSGIRTGADYLRAWIASIVRHPFEPVPYLFLYGPQNSGKSILHEAIEEALFTSGVVRADRALTNQNDFNGELANAVLAVVEEKHIGDTPGAYSKLKDWVTAPTISIRKMKTDSYSQPNTTHWIQCSNEQSACPIFPGDTRITALFVDALPPGSEIPKRELLSKLRQEAPHFLRTLLDMPLPEPEGRLRLPVIETETKRRAELDNTDSLALAISELMAERTDWEGAACELEDATGASCPRDIRLLKRRLGSATEFLKVRGINVDYPPQRTSKGWPIHFWTAA